MSLNKKTIVWLVIFTGLFMVSGIVGRLYQASAGLVIIILTGYLIRRDLSFKSLLIIQLPILVVATFVVFKDQLYDNLVLIVTSYIAMLLLFLTEKFGKNYLKRIYISLLVVLPLLAYAATGKWFHYRSSQYVADKQLSFPDIIMKDSLGNGFTFPTDDKLYVVDFWATTCGICFKEMKKLEVLKKKFESNPNVKFLSLNLPIERDSIGYAQTVLKKKDIHLTSLYCEGLTSWSKLGIEGVPMIYFVRNNQIMEIHSGGLEVLYPNTKPSLENDILNFLGK